MVQSLMVLAHMRVKEVEGVVVSHARVVIPRIHEVVQQMLSPRCHAHTPRDVDLIVVCDILMGGDNGSEGVVGATRIHVLSEHSGLGRQVALEVACVVVSQKRERLRSTVLLRLHVLLAMISVDGEHGVHHVPDREDRVIDPDGRRGLLHHEKGFVGEGDVV